MIHGRKLQAQPARLPEWMPERVVALAPSVTAVVRAIGEDDCLVGGTSHEWDADSVGGWLTPDPDAIAALDPDHVITTDPLQANIASTLRERDFVVEHFNPRRLADVYQYVRDLGDLLGAASAADTLATELQSQVDRVRERVRGRPRPIVYCEEWHEPPMAAGNWVPDIVDAAGGRYPFRPAGARSRPVSRETVEQADPDVAILHICGYGENVPAGTIRDRGWHVTATRSDRVHAIDDSLLNQPGPNVGQATERLAQLLHPDAFDGEMP